MSGQMETLLRQATIIEKSKFICFIFNFNEANMLK